MQSVCACVCLCKAALSGAAILCLSWKLFFSICWFTATLRPTRRRSPGPDSAWGSLSCCDPCTPALPKIPTAPPNPPLPVTHSGPEEHMTSPRPLPGGSGGAKCTVTQLRSRVLGETSAPPPRRADSSEVSSVPRNSAVSLSSLRSL